MNDIEKAIELLNEINSKAKSENMAKDCLDNVTEEERKEYIESFRLIKLAIVELQKSMSKRLTVEDFLNTTLRDNTIHIYKKYEFKERPICTLPGGGANYENVIAQEILNAEVAIITPVNEKGILIRIEKE